MTPLLEPPSAAAPAGASTEALQPKSSWLARFSRVTTSGRFIPEIDGFRFLAIAGVFFAHDTYQVAEKAHVFDAQGAAGLPLLDRWLLILTSTGAIGVQFFFVISGFILALPFADHYLCGNKKPRLRAYYWRRVTRLEPPYLLIMALWAAMIPLYKSITVGETIRHYFVSMFYLHNQVYAEGSVINNVAWSLEVEVQFYLLAPVLAALFFTLKDVRLRRLLLGIVVAITALFNSTLAPESYRYQASLLNAIQYFLAGFLLADVYLLNRSFLGGEKHWGWDLAAVAAAGVTMASMILGGGHWGSLTFHLPFCILLICIAGFKGQALNWFLTRAPVFLIGGMCYTIYLMHGHLTSLLGVVLRPLYVHSLPLWVNYLLHGTIHIVVILVICMVMFRLIERPCMQKNWPQKLYRRWFPVESAPARSDGSE